MRKVVLIPDSFKGTMSSAEVCAIMAEVITAHEPGVQVVCLPVADGGEGSVDAFLGAVGGTKVTSRVTGPFPGEPVDAFYGRLDQRTAVIDGGRRGLPLVERAGRTPAPRPPTGWGS